MVSGVARKRRSATELGCYYLDMPPRMKQAKRWILILAGLLIGAGYVLPLFPNGSQTYVDLQALGNFTFDQYAGGMKDVPLQWRSLDGKKVRLRGFMLFPDIANGRVKSFQLVYDVSNHHKSPVVQERVFAACSHRSAIPYSDFVDLTGTFHVKPVHEDSTGPLTSLFTLDVDSINESGEPVTHTISRWAGGIGWLLLIVWCGRAFLEVIRRYGRMKPGVCQICGYDLRASRGRCPECGNVYDGAMVYVDQNGTSHGP